MIRLVALAVIFGVLVWGEARAELPRVRAEGTRFVDASGRPVVLKGCNLGNWLVMEMWMCHWGGAHDQWEAEKVLAERFGVEQKDRWIEQYREGFIQDRDFELIKEFGFNCVRIPLHYTNVLEAEAPYAVRADAFKRIDRALEMCERHGVYAILDLHAAPGAQSVDHNAGRAGHNQLWADEACQDAMVRFWAEVAKRYAGRSVIAAYDILNEPYGNYRGDLGGPMLALAKRTYAAIRAHDREHVVLLPAVIGAGLRMYENDEVRGWEQVGFTEHHYPGLFGSAGGLKNMMGYLYRGLPELQGFVERNGRPLLIGEFNGATHSNGGVYLTRMQFDQFARYGWAATMWSYKILKPSAGAGIDGWYTVTNAAPMTRIDLKTCTAEEMERYLQEVATGPLVVHGKLKEVLGAEKVALAAEMLELPPTRAPEARVDSPWTTTSIGGAEGVDAGARVFAKGSDIFGASDSFVYLHRNLHGSASIETTVEKLVESDQYAKAGVMMRAGLAADAAFAFMHAFPDGTLAFCWRPATGERAQEKKFHVGELPVRVRLVREGDALRGFYWFDNKWVSAGEVSIGAGEWMAGLAVTSHSGRYFTVAQFRDTELEDR